ncbi:MAG: hypothetical protein WCS72_13810 [Deltaproteobacteria bacterium]
MPRAAKPTDPWSSFVDLLADTLAERLDFPPRASSAASALSAPPDARARRRKSKRTSVLAAHLVDELIDALAARIDFPPRASSAESIVVSAGPRKKRAPSRPASSKRSPRSPAP